MGVRWTRISLEDRQRRFRQAINTLPEAKSDMADLGKQVAQTMQHNIESRGTAYSAYRSSVLGRGTGGRHDTGTMVDAVDSRVTAYSGVVNAEAGWINDFEQYFNYQEKGTRQVEAMHALADAAQEGRDQLDRVGEHVLERVARKLN